MSDPSRPKTSYQALTPTSDKFLPLILKKVMPDTWDKAFPGTFDPALSEVEEKLVYAEIWGWHRSVNIIYSII